MTNNVISQYMTAPIIGQIKKISGHSRLTIVHVPSATLHIAREWIFKIIVLLLHL